MIATPHLSTPFEAPPCPSVLRSGSSGCQNFSANWKTVMSTSPRMIHGRPTANRLCLYVRIATKIPMGASCTRERELSKYFNASITNATSAVLSALFVIWPNAALLRPLRSMFVRNTFLQCLSHTKAFNPKAKPRLTVNEVRRFCNSKAKLRTGTDVTKFVAMLRGSLCQVTLW